MIKDPTVLLLDEATSALYGERACCAGGFGRFAQEAQAYDDHDRAPFVHDPQRGQDLCGKRWCNRGGRHSRAVDGETRQILLAPRRADGRGRCCLTPSSNDTAPCCSSPACF